MAAKKNPMKGRKNPNAGRKTKYKEEHNEQVEKLCKLGMIDKEIAEFFSVNEDTINEWKKRHKEFSESIKRGKQVADAEVAEKLYQRACGYSHKAVKMFQSGGAVIKEDYIEHYPPDTGACMAWLKNRQKDKWRDKQEHEIAGKDGKPIQTENTNTHKLDENIAEAIKNLYQ
jgi:transposase